MAGSWAATRVIGNVPPAVQKGFTELTGTVPAYIRTVRGQGKETNKAAMENNIVIIKEYDKEQLFQIKRCKDMNWYTGK